MGIALFQVLSYRRDTNIILELESAQYPPPDTPYTDPGLSVYPSPKLHVSSLQCKKPNRDGWAKCKKRYEKVLVGRARFELATYGLRVDRTSSFY